MNLRVVAGTTTALVLSMSSIWGCRPTPPVLSGYRSLVGANGAARLAPHAGIDLGAALGTPVMAAASGHVENVDYDPAGCGLSVLLFHDWARRYTVYCHLSATLVRRGQRVQRGEPIARVGATGNAGEIPHLHWQVCRVACPFGNRDGLLEDTEDPARYLRGCHRPGRRYPKGRLVLTSPLRCGL